MEHYARLIPDFILSIGATVILLLGPLRDSKPLRDFLRWFALILLGASAVTLVVVNRGVDSRDLLFAFDWLTSAPLGVLFSLVFIGCIAWTVLAGSVPEDNAGEWYSTLLFVAAGMVVLARSANLMAVFLGLELFSIALYILIAFFYQRRAALRAGAMYLVLAGFASSFLLFGMALVYAHYGTVDIGEIRTAAVGKPMPYVAAIGFGLFLVGVAFKLAVVPFHMWTPEVYEASPGVVTGLIASASKGAMLAAFIPFLFLRATHWQILWVFAALSMIGGNLLGLREFRVKRILAYSSIAHIGYVLTGYLAGDAVSVGARFLPGITGVSAVFFYVVAYALAILGAFGVLSLLDRENDVTLRDLRGIGRRSPLLAFCMLVFVWSLASLPPTAGFFGKIYLFAAAVNQGYLWLPLLGLVGSAIGIYYYLRIIVHLFMMPSDASDIKVKSTLLQEWVLLATAVATIVAGTFPETVLSLMAWR